MLNSTHKLKVTYKEDQLYEKRKVNFQVLQMFYQETETKNRKKY